ncbi:MAG TPA: FGGY-family carbohydrate kinase [Armatimonadota bacterium]|nr:FGGY-family carbohydrate kinase [Armatimonadota bacterium]
MSLLGVEIGVTQCTAAVFDYAGKLLCQHTLSYSIDQSADGAMELNADHVMSCVQTAINNVSKSLGRKNNGIRAIGISVQGESICPVDTNGRPLGPVMTTYDHRTIPQFGYITKTLGAERLQHITGLAPLPSYSLAKILWWAVHRPDVMEKTAHFFDLGSLLLQRFGLKPVMDYSIAGRTMLMDIEKKQWSTEILTAVGIPRNVLPSLAEAGTVLGTISGRAARQFGLPRNTYVVLGGHDQACAAFGCGVIENESAMDATGATECVAAVTSSPVIGPQMLMGGYGCYPHVVPGRYLILAYNFSAGSLFRWFREILGGIEEEESRGSGLSFSEVLLGKASSGPSSVLVLPHFARAGTPWHDDSAHGAIIGLSLATSRAEFIKGFFDGLGYEMRMNFDLLADAGVPVSMVHVIGGGANSPRWLQLKADIYRREVKGITLDVASAFGAALLAGIGVGVWQNAHEAVQAVVPTPTYIASPFQHDAEQYQQYYERYRRMYPAVKAMEQ